ncbi:MAG: hypothetical protein ACFFD4_16485 [Candidatus Odinarchaeota archaeon]
MWLIQRFIDPNAEFVLCREITTKS